MFKKNLMLSCKFPAFLGKLKILATLSLHFYKAIISWSWVVEVPCDETAFCHSPHHSLMSPYPVSWGSFFLSRNSHCHFTYRRIKRTAKLVQSRDSNQNYLGYFGFVSWIYWFHLHSEFEGVGNSCPFIIIVNTITSFSFFWWCLSLLGRHSNTWATSPAHCGFCCVLSCSEERHLPCSELSYGESSYGKELNKVFDQQPAK